MGFRGLSGNREINMMMMMMIFAKFSHPCTICSLLVLYYYPGIPGNFLLPTGIVLVNVGPILMKYSLNRSATSCDFFVFID